MIRAFAAIVLLAASAIAQDAPGMYVDQAGALVKIEHASTSGTSTRGVAKSAFVPGATPSVVWEFSGAQAPIRVSARPRLVYKVRSNQAVSERDLVLVRMDPKSDHREIRVGKVGAWTGNARAGFDQSKLVAITVTRNGDTLEITPAGDLPAGEFFLAAGFSPVGYDFGVDSK